MKLVKAHGKQVGQGSPKKASGPRILKRKIKGTQEPISRKNQWSYQVTERKSKRLA